MTYKRQKNYGSSMFNKKNFMIKEGYITKELQNSQLNLKIHEDGIIRLHGRLHNADIQMTQLILYFYPEKTLTRLIIEDIHCRLVHRSSSHTFAQIQNKYWIPKARTEVKKILKKYLICVRN